MRYQDILPYFTQYHLGQITKQELGAVICMWQRAGALL